MPRSRLTAVEERTGRCVELINNEHDAPGRFDDQPASPLFSTLPPEIRDIIWGFATAPYEDETKKFAETAYYYRPGRTASLKTETALLLTCRRVWLEANAMPMLQAEHSYYYRREAPDRRDPKWTANLTVQNRANFGHLHLFVQMCNIENLTAEPGKLRKYFLFTPAIAGDFQPRVFHCTVRHTDWWYWENDDPIYLHESWVQAMLNSPDLRSTQVFKLELETLDYKTDQLEPIVERIKALVSEEKATHIVDGQAVTTKFVLSDRQDSYTWQGPTNIDGKIFTRYDGKDRLIYHVVTLTWKLTFPSLPRAFVPQLRRAPRIPKNKTPDSPNLTAFYFAAHLPHLYHATTDRQFLSKRKRLEHPDGTTWHISDVTKASWHHRWIMLLAMQRCAEELQSVTERQAALEHENRRGLFEEEIQKSLRRQYADQWVAEGSLLRFVE
ncbi:hypothetical protein LTR62_000597 [Meristemomyces frigidus]|uniref:Uncharacterized protein n=1 Tax=Meristemomyces frigidus TaxID=1508187 RepID=A0AAN7TA32_9PEZI|nr:hypothetical protein LTR62_000597 [Meristemomyces frigidus]